MSALWPIIRKGLAQPRRTAIVDDRDEYSYLKLIGGGLFLAERLDAMTDKRHVGILLPTTGAFAIAMIGTWLSRRTIVPLNFLLARSELEYVIRDSGIDTIITADAMLDYLGGPQVLPSDITLLKLEEMDTSGVPPLRWPPMAGGDELAALLYTSGTSGRPKGVMLSHGNLRSNARAAIEHAGIKSADTFLGVLPQFHAFGLTALTLVPLYMGSRIVYSARFIPKRIHELIVQHRPDIFIGIPSMYGALLSVREAKAEDFSSIRMAVSGAEPLPSAIYEGFRDRFNTEILEGYGLTEASPITHWSTPRAQKRHGVGRALPGVRTLILDERDRVLPPDEQGEIVLAGPNIMQGYYHLPEETEAAFITIEEPDGTRRRYFRTGDIGKVDADGFLYITGRKKEMMIVGGENVFPREIEEVLNAHPHVHASAVIGRPDGIRGEVPIAFIELEEDTAFDETVLRQWCRDRLANYKVPRQIRAVEKLPRSGTGKVLRRQLSPQ